MARSEFRWNKKRKHFAYLFKDAGDLRFNFLLSTKQFRFVHGKPKRNIKLFRHPNIEDDLEMYLIPFIYFDTIESFGGDIYNWSFDKNDKRIVKHLKKRKLKHKKSQL